MRAVEGCIDGADWGLRAGKLCLVRFRSDVPHLINSHLTCEDGETLGGEASGGLSVWEHPPTGSAAGHTTRNR